MGDLNLIALPDRAVLRVHGEDARSFLQGLITQDVTALSVDQALYSLFLNAQGKFLFDFFLIADGADILLEMDAARAPEFLKLLSLYKLRAKVAIEDISADYAVYAALDTKPDLPGFVFTDPRHTEMGWRIVSPSGATLEAATTPEDYTARRITLGIPEGDLDNIPSQTLPLENGLDYLNAISFHKGCYIGQEVTARTHWRAKLRKGVYIVEGKSQLPSAHTAILRGEREAGKLLTTQGQHGLALLRMDAVDSGETLMADGTELHATLPGWREKAERAASDSQ